MIQMQILFIQQAPRIHTVPDPKYSDKDVGDLVEYIQIRAEGVEKYLYVEETDITSEAELSADQPDLTTCPR
jgi:hypothetical protein